MSKAMTVGELKAIIRDNIPDEWGVTVWNGSHDEAYWVELVDTSIHGRIELNFYDPDSEEIHE